MTLAQLEDVRDMFGIQDTEKSDTQVGDAIAYASKRIQQLTKKAWDGHFEREYIGTSDGATADFTTGIFPVLDALQSAEGEPSDDSTDITLESKAIGGSSFSAISSGTYVLKGETGRIIFSTIPSEGVDLFATYFYDTFKVRYAEAALAASYLFDGMGNGEEKAVTAYNQFVECMADGPFYVTLERKTLARQQSPGRY